MNEGGSASITYLSSKLVAIATSLEQSENEREIVYLHPHVYTNPENSLKIGPVHSEITGVQEFARNKGRKKNGSRIYSPTCMWHAERWTDRHGIL